MQYLRHFIPQTIQMLLGILLLLIFFNQILLLEWVLFGKRIPGFRCSEWLQNEKWLLGAVQAQPQDSQRWARRCP